MFKHLLLKLSGIGLGLLCLALATPQVSPAASIGVKLGSNVTGSTMDPADVAGAPGYTQSNWNNASGGTGTLAAGAVKDSTGAVVAGMAFSWDSSGTYNALSGTSTAPNDKLNCGFLYTSTGAGAKQIMFTNVPYAFYDVVVYFANDGTNRYTRIQTNNSASYYVRNVQWTRSGATMGTYAQAPYYMALSQAQGDTKGYSHLVIPGITGSTLTITHQTYNGNDGICAVQILPAKIPMEVNLSANTVGTTTTLGNMITFTAAINKDSSLTIDHVDLLVDGVVVQTKKTPAYGSTYTQEWFTSAALPGGTGRAFTIQSIAYTTANTTATAYMSVGVCEPDYNPYNVIPVQSDFTNVSTSDPTNPTNAWGEFAWKAVDRNLGTIWGQVEDPSAAPPTPPCWWKINAGSAKTINFYRLIGMRGNYTARQPQNFSLSVSSDGTNWTKVDTQTSQSTPMPAMGFKLASPATGQYFKMDMANILRPTDKYIEMTEFQFLNLPAIIEMATPLSVGNATMGQKITVNAKVTGDPGSDAEVRFFSGPRLLGKGVNMGNGIWALDYIADRQATFQVRAQLVCSKIVLNTVNWMTIAVTQVPVEMSRFSAE